MTSKRKVKSAKETTVNNRSKSNIKNTDSKDILLPDLENMDWRIEILNERVHRLEHKDAHVHLVSPLFNPNAHEQDDCGCGKNKIKRNTVPGDILLPVAIIGFSIGVLLALNFTSSRYY